MSGGIKLEDVIVRIMELPVNVRAFTVTDEQGDYNVYLNCALSFEQQQKSLQHERRHITNGDFYKADSALSIEKKAMAK